MHTTVYSNAMELNLYWSCICIFTNFNLSKTVSFWKSFGNKKYKCNFIKFWPHCVVQFFLYTYLCILSFLNLTCNPHVTVRWSTRYTQYHLIRTAFSFITFQNLRTISTGFRKIKDQKKGIVSTILGKFTISYTQNYWFSNN